MNDKKQNIVKKIFTAIIFLCLFALLIFLAIEMFEPIKEAIKVHSLTPVEEKLESFGIWKYLIITVLQIIIIVCAIFPTQIIQIIAGFCCGAVMGFLCCMCGIFLANIIIYIIFNHNNKKGKNIEKQQDQIKKVSEIDNSSTSSKSLFFILSLYFVPGVPYGVASMYAAGKKIGFLKYIFLTTLGSAPATILFSIFGNFAIEEKYLAFTILLSLFCLILVIGLKFKNQLINHFKNRSIRATLIWLLVIFINAGVSVYFAAINDLKHMFFNILLFFGYLLLYLIFNRTVSKLFDKARNKYNMNYFQGPVKKANRLLYGFLIFFIKIYFFIKYNVKVDKKNMPDFNKPCILLFNHPAKLDFIYSFVPLYPRKVNPVVAYYYFCNYHVGRLLKNLGAFPKYLYQPDVSAMKNIVRVIKNDGTLGIAPEGRLSAYGCMEKIIPSTAKMIKKFGVQVILTKIHGSYFSTPKWAKTSRRGKVTVEYKEIFTPEDLKQLSTTEIYDILKKECDYDEFKWQEENHVAFKGKKFAEGLEQILYICPVCKKEYTYSSRNDTLICSHCHTEVKLDKFYQFSSSNNLIPKNIRDWYIFQKEVERKAINDPNFSFSSHVTLKHPTKNGKGFEVVGDGFTTLDKNGIKYIGTIYGEEKEILFKIENLPAVPFGVLEDFEIYHHNTLYYFIPDNIRECVKWSVTSEQMYAKYLEDNNLKELEISE